MDSFKSLIISFVLVGLCAYALLQFGFGLQQSNNLNTTILDDGALNQFNSSINSNLEEFQTAQNAQLNATNAEQSEEIQPAGDLSLGSIFHSITTFGSFLFGIGASLLSPTFLGQIGVDATTSAILISILGVTAVLVAWRLLKIGQ